MTDLQDVIDVIQNEQTDAFVVGYLQPDGVTQVAFGGDLQRRDHQAMSAKLLTAYVLRSATSQYTDPDEGEAEFIGHGLHWLDNETAMLEDMVEAGLLPEDALPQHHDNAPDEATAADMLRQMVADADVDLTSIDPDPSDDDEDGDSNGTNIPIN